MPRLTRFSGYSQGASNLTRQLQEKVQDTRETPRTQGKRVMELQQFTASREFGEHLCPFLCILIHSSSPTSDEGTEPTKRRTGICLVT